jgi:formate-dependent nitrite reductase cytochrome c552 subunit
MAWGAGLICLTLALLQSPAPALAQVDTASAAAPSVVEELAAELRDMENAKCLTCHIGDSLHEQDSKFLFSVPSNGNGTLRRSPGFIASNHGDLACVNCHVGAFQDFPHDAPEGQMAAATLECNECHAQKTHTIGVQLARSVHAENYADSFTCTTCHDPHVMISGTKGFDPATLVKQDNSACLACHATAETFLAVADGAVAQPEWPDIDAIHLWLPNTQRHWEAVRCVDCHTPKTQPGNQLGISHEVLGKEAALKDCATCHTMDSVLRTTLYRHARESGSDTFRLENAVIAQNSYVVGATRSPVLDIGAILLVLATLGGVALHGLLRWVASKKRKG